MLHLMPWALLDVLDVALKLAAAFLAIRLIRFTRGRWVWFAMAGALLLRALRRLLPLLASGGWLDRAGFSPAPEQAFVSLLVSSLFVAALWKLRDYLEESRQTEDLLAAEASRRESEGRYRALFEQAGDYALVLEPREDGSLIILDVNEAALQAHGYARAELVGQPLSVLDPFQDPELLAPRLEAIRQHGMALFQVKHRRKDGSLFDAEVRTTLVHLDGRPVLLSSERDITDRLKAEEERRELQARLNQAQKLESLGILAGGVAHDMNNVLAAILGIASSLKEKMAPSSPDGHSLETVMQACTRGRGVVKGLLYFARKDLQEECAIDLNALVRDLVQLLGFTTLKRFSLETDLEAGLGSLRGDEGAISHALMNLCVNSMDAMEEGGRLTIRTRSLPGGGLELSVADTGAGMPPEVLARAMDPFFTTKPVGKGTGLGLSMVFGTMSAHGGTVELRSRIGQGTEAVLTFPASRVEAPAEPPGVPAPPSAADRHALSILVIDDDELVRESVQIMLEGMGHRPVLASGGQEALDLFGQALSVDLVILDMNMPGMNGAETLVHLQSARPDLPVLIATGYSDENVKALLEGRPKVGSVRKPFSAEELGRKLADLGACPSNR